MHFGTNEVFQGTFTRKCLEKILKYGKISPERVQAIMMSISDVPQDEGEVSILHVINTLAKPQLLETRKAFAIIRTKDKLIVAIGLAPTQQIAEEQEFDWSRYSVVEISFNQFNNYRLSSDSLMTFGL
jgi:hypothetical protein